MKAAVGAVAEKVEERRAADKGHKADSAHKADEVANAGDAKDPEIRTAERRNPTMSTPDKTGESQATVPAADNSAEAAGVAQNLPAGDGKPAGDTRGTEEKK